MIWSSIVVILINAIVFAAEGNPLSRSSYIMTRGNKRLAGHVVERYRSISFMSCSQSCLRNSWCTSTNFKVSFEQEDKGTCELNTNEISPISEDTELTDQPGVIFSMFLKGCLMTGCLNGGSCLFDNETFTCSCEPPWSGDKCAVRPAADKERIIMWKELIPNKTLEDHVIRHEDVLNEGSCRVLCYMEPNCVSINMGPLEGGKHKCELNNATAKQQNHTFPLKNMDGYTYLAIENTCSSKPCLNNGVCQVGFSEKRFRCLCRAGFIGKKCKRQVHNCADLYNAGKKRNGVYAIKPDNADVFDVFCDQTTDGGGWTVFQKRMDGSVDFYRNWADYKRGFGNLNGEFWLGLDKIHRLTSDGNAALRVDLEDGDGYTSYANYTRFSVGSEESRYQLSLDGVYHGTAGDSLYYHNQNMFSTKDRDNDKKGISCAQVFHGAWWYNACHKCSLNGVYHIGGVQFGNGINWNTWRAQTISLKRAEMKIRPRQFQMSG